MHHGSEPPPKAPGTEEMRQLREKMEELARQAELGATGQFPQGQLNPSDEGEIKIAISATDGKVVMNFGKPILWIGFDPKQARQLAESLRKRSYEAQEQPH